MIQSEMVESIRIIGAVCVGHQHERADDGLFAVMVGGAN